MRRALVFAAFALLAGSCAKSSPTAPLTAAPAALPAFADFSGVTLVTFKESTCQGWRGCFATVGGTHYVELRLTQSIGAVSGVLIESATSAVRVTGTVSDDGELTLTGWRPRVETFTSGSDHGRGIGTFKLRRDANGTATGTVLMIGDWNGYTVGAPGFVTTGGEVLAAERMQALPVQSGFAGTWRGRYIVKNCRVTGSKYCRPRELGEVDNFTMTLSSNGNLLSGSATNIAPVSGTASGDLLTLSGEGPGSYGSTSRNTITSWNTYRDAAGQLHGTLTYVVESPTLRTEYEIELYFVMLDSPATASVIR